MVRGLKEMSKQKPKISERKEQPWPCTHSAWARFPLAPCCWSRGWAPGLPVASGLPSLPFLHAFQGCWQSST